MSPWIPPEIAIHITSFIVDLSTLFALRSVDHVWSAAADIQLKNVAYVSTTKETQDRFDSLISDSAARNSIRSLIVNAPDRDYWALRGPPNRVLSTHDSIHLRRRLSEIIEKEIPKLPNLQHVSLHIRPPPRDIAPFTCSIQMKTIFLRFLLREFFCALRGLPGLQELSLQSFPVQANFPVLPPESFTQKTIANIIHKLKLKSLKLGYVGPNVWSPSDDDFFRKDFDPPNIWLQYAKPTLRHLSLTCWGFYLRDIPNSCLCTAHRIPHLESLELGNIGFTSDISLTWILNHGATLRSLVFQDCALVHSLEIQSHFTITEPNQSVETVKKDGTEIQIFHSRWDGWFRKFQKGLPKLTNFKFGSRRVRALGEEGPEFASEKKLGPPFEKPAKFLFGLFPDRYIAMTDGEDSCPWIFRAPGPQHYAQPNNNVQDRKALRALMRKLGQTFKESDTSTHAAFVEKLIGQVRSK